MIVEGHPGDKLAGDAVKITNQNQLWINLDRTVTGACSVSSGMPEDRRLPHHGDAAEYLKDLLSGSRPYTLIRGDSAEVLRKIPTATFDVLCCDPPAGINFMSAAFDSDRGGRQKWVAWLASILSEARRTLKPGAYGFIWALPRTSHWTGDAVEQAGFEVRDVLHDALPGSTLLDQFEASLDAEQAAAFQRLLEAFGACKLRQVQSQGFPKSRALLKPAVEEWFLVRNPGAPIAALRIDDCRVQYQGNTDFATARTRFTGKDWKATHEGWQRPHKLDADPEASRDKTTPAGRWPANLVLEHSKACRRVGESAVRSNGHYPARRGEGSKVSGPSGHRGQDGLQERHTSGEVVQVWECSEDCPVRQLGEQSGRLTSGGSVSSRGGVRQATPAGLNTALVRPFQAYEDRMGSAARFFHQLDLDPFLYQAKASRRERNAGCANNHPTTKPVGLMRHLCRLISQPGALVLDPFCGSGTTGVACAAEGLRFCGIELEEAYADIAEGRLRHAFCPAGDEPRAPASRPSGGKLDQLNLL